MNALDIRLKTILGGRYEIRELIGKGGMANVYKAYDITEKRIVAVKVLCEEYLTNEEVKKTFINDYRALAILSHPNIVKIYDYSLDTDPLYIVMEHVEGITLKEYIERQRIVKWQEAIHFISQILRALQHAHDKGIVHCDIKPQNILLLPNATIKVTDFGIARFMNKPANSNDSTVGSVEYMSPEQAQNIEIDERSDIYSIGIVLYEMLTGKLPFTGKDDDEILLNHTETDAERPALINATVPVGLEQITLRAMMRNPDDRYQSAAEFLRDIDSFKLNPRIKFDYQVFEDTSPTKHAGAKGENVRTVPSVPAEQELSSSDYEDDYYDEEEDEDYRPRNMALPILAVIAVCLVVIVGIIILVAFGDTIRDVVSGESTASDEADESFLEKIDIFGWFGKDKNELPNFLNMKYEAVIEKYPDLYFDEPQYEYNSSYEDGYVCGQSPEAGAKVSSDTVIKLTVATSGGMVLIRQVAGLTTKEAETVLREDGLVVVLVAQVDETKEEGEVISTWPVANKYIARNGIVYVYYASSAENIDSLRVPDVVGFELTAAKAKIESVGLKVGNVSQGASAAAMKGLVISQSPEGLSPVNSGEYIDLVVGTGVPSANTVQVNINLPEMTGGTTGTVRTFLNNNAYDSISGVLLDGSSYQVSFTGTGTSNPFKIYIDAVLIYSGNIDFTTSPPSISDLRQYDFAKKEFVPDVVGKSYDDAVSILDSAGFRRIHTRYESSETVAASCIISQSPVASKTNSYSTETMITLVISSGSSNESAEPSVTEQPTENTGAEETEALVG